VWSWSSAAASRQYGDEFPGCNDSPVIKAMVRDSGLDGTVTDQTCYGVVHVGKRQLNRGLGGASSALGKLDALNGKPLDGRRR
jgi:hypothetical protein